MARQTGIPFILPDIDVDKIGSLDEAKQAFRQSLNSFEQLLKLCYQQQKEIAELKQEIARLKRQPKTPQFSSPKTQSTTTIRYLIKISKALGVKGSTNRSLIKCSLIKYRRCSVEQKMVKSYQFMPNMI